MAEKPEETPEFDRLFEHVESLADLIRDYAKQHSASWQDLTFSLATVLSHVLDEFEDRQLARTGRIDPEYRKHVDRSPRLARPV